MDEPVHQAKDTTGERLAQSSGDAAPSEPSSGDKPLPKAHPAETLTALAGALGAAVTQLLDVDNAAVVSVLIALLGLLPALVTWLVEIGKKWDEPGAGRGTSSGIQGEVAHFEEMFLRHAAITGEPHPQLDAISSVRAKFATPKEANSTKPGEPGAQEVGGKGQAT